MNFEIMREKVALVVHIFCSYRSHLLLDSEKLDTTSVCDKAFCFRILHFAIAATHLSVFNTKAKCDLPQKWGLLLASFCRASKWQYAFIFWRLQTLGVRFQEWPCIQGRLLAPLSELPRYRRPWMLDERERLLFVWKNELNEVETIVLVP